MLPDQPGRLLTNPKSKDKSMASALISHTGDSRLSSTKRQAAGSTRPVSARRPECCTTSPWTRTAKSRHSTSGSHKRPSSGSAKKCSSRSCSSWASSDRRRRLSPGAFNWRERSPRPRGNRRVISAVHHLTVGCAPTIDSRARCGPDDQEGLMSSFNTHTSTEARVPGVSDASIASNT